MIHTAEAEAELCDDPSPIDIRVGLERPICDRSGCLLRIVVSVAIHSGGVRRLNSVER